MDGSSHTHAAPELACTLGSERVADRLAEWRAMLAQATTNEAIDGGRRFHFRRGLDVGALARLAAAERDCCSFFVFGLTIDGDGVTLDVTAPDEASPAIEALTGTAV